MDEINQATYHIDEVSTLEMLRMFNNEDKKVALVIESCLEDIARAVDLLYACIKAGGRAIYIGSGTGGKIGVLDATECPPTFGVSDDVFTGLISGGSEALGGWREGTEDDEELAVTDLLAIQFSASDILIGISASGNTPYVLSALRHARNIGGKTISVCCSPRGKISALSDICITADVGPEAIMGSTRLKGGTAQKMILNMLSSGTMIRMGKTYHNLMVDVRPINAKLRQRVQDIVRIVTDKDHALVLQALNACGWNCKDAILMLELGVDSSTAQKLLAAHGGYLKRIIQSHTTNTTSPPGGPYVQTPIE